jgi:hypothetical protein
MEVATLVNGRRIKWTTHECSDADALERVIGIARIIMEAQIGKRGTIPDGNSDDTQGISA